LPPPRSQTSSQPLNAATAIERSCRHQTPAIFVVHRRSQTPPPALSPPPPPPSIAIFLAVASPPPRRSTSPRPSNARRPLSRLRPSPAPSNAIAHRHRYADALCQPPRRHCHLDLIVQSAPPHRLVVVVLPLYTRRRQGRSPKRREGQWDGIPWPACAGTWAG
jgi:hypothetical protein